MIGKKNIVFVVLALIPFLICQGSDTSKAKLKKNTGSLNTIESEGIGIPVIYETDLTLDVDDVGALAVLHGLQMEGKVNILGVCYNEVHPLAPAVIDAINTYYRRGTIPIGIYRKSLSEPDPSDYFSHERDYDVDNMMHDSFDNMVADAVEVYKHLLKNQTDSSVVIISVGFLNNLHDLLLDPEGMRRIIGAVKYRSQWLFSTRLCLEISGVRNLRLMMPGSL